jgi:thiol-disulfide isomerase/thioredoxin
MKTGPDRDTRMQMTERPAEPQAAEPPSQEPAAGGHGRRLLAAGGLGLAVGLVLAGAVYGIAAFKRNAAETGDPACRGAVELARRLAPLVHGEVAALMMAERPLRLPNLTMRDEAGAERHLADWRGRTVLLNLWATWCVPCRQEMPALDALQAKLGGPAFEVVAINIDTRDSEKPRAWFKEVGIKQLAYYADPSAKVFQELKAAGKALGMPTTVLIDPAGCEIATLAGPAEWASEDALRVVSAALQK